LRDTKYETFNAPSSATADRIFAHYYRRTNAHRFKKIDLGSVAFNSWWGTFFIFHKEIRITPQMMLVKVESIAPY
jgi:hypothetical protein